MSHRDTVFEPPPGFAALASSPARRWPRSRTPERGLYGIQFHPEVVHTPHGTEILNRFLRDVAGCEREVVAGLGRSTSRSSAIRAQVGDGRVICGLSGGVDSAVAALLVHRAIGDQLTCVLVDHGLMRKDEAEQVVDRLPRPASASTLVHVDAADRFLDAARRRRRPRGEAQDHRRGVHPGLRGGGRRSSRTPGFLVQGTLYSDVIESGGDGRRGGDDQVAPQRRRPARGPRLRAGRAAAHAVQGRGPRRRRRARPARAHRLAPAVPGPGPRDPRSSAARSPGSGSRSSARPTRSSRRRSAPPASTASSGSRSACCRSSARSACRATSAPTPTRS